MNASSIGSGEHQDFESRVERFLAWFGIGYAVVSLFILPQWGRLLLRANPLDSIRQLPHLYCRGIIEVSSIGLLAGCVLLLCRQARARQVLFGWAVFAVTMELVYWSATRTYVRGADPAWLILHLVEISLGLGFPLMLLGAMGIKRDRVSRGFAVVTGGPSDDLRPVEVVIGTFEMQLLRWMIVVAVAMGVVGTAQAAREWWFGVIFVDGTAWRASAILALLRVRGLSWSLLLMGAILIWFRPKPGRRIVMGWAMLFIGLSVSIGLLYDVLYVYWQARNGPRGIWIGQKAANHAQDWLRSSAFAIIALYLLWRMHGTGQHTDVPTSQQKGEQVVNDPGDFHS